MTIAVIAEPYAITAACFRAVFGQIARSTITVSVPVRTATTPTSGAQPATPANPIDVREMGQQERRPGPP